jgi:tol-pal system protein YbgF
LNLKAVLPGRFYLDAFPTKFSRYPAVVYQGERRAVSAGLGGKNTELIFMGIKSTLLAALLLSASAAPGLALETNLPGVRLGVAAQNAIPLPQADIPGEAPLLVAQDATSNVAVEEQIRLLNGKVEELTFQILQMQEQVRKLQEDNEFRFQELEKSKQGNAGPKVRPADDTASAAPAAPKDPDKVRVVTTDNAGNGDPVAGVIDGTAGEGAAPQDLGTVKFDENGNPVGATAAAPDKVAAIPPADNPAELYKTAYEHILSGEYPSAEAAFRAHIKNFPADPQTADARYWLGESLIGQDRYRDAAEVLLKAQKEFPKSKKAPDMLLKLGVSLSALDNKDVACATFAQVAKKYPRAAPAVMERVAAEQAKAGC